MKIACEVASTGKSGAFDSKQVRNDRELILSRCPCIFITKVPTSYELNIMHGDMMCGTDRMILANPLDT